MGTLKLVRGTRTPKSSTFGKRVICVSWHHDLALTRQLLLGHIGCRVVSALGREEAMESCRETAAMLVLGHSVPQEEKRKVIRCFRQHSQAPVLSLLAVNQEKLPEADFGVMADNPELFLQTVARLLQ